MTQRPAPRLQLQRPEDRAALRGSRSRRGGGARATRRPRGELSGGGRRPARRQAAPAALRRRAATRSGERSRSVAAWPPTRCCATASPSSASAEGLELKLVARELCTDNAAMIASAARFLEPTPYPGYLGWDAAAELFDASVVTLYGRPGCHLCDEAREAIARAGRGARNRAPRSRHRERRSPARAYLERIPVVEVDGRDRQ